MGISNRYPSFHPVYGKFTLNLAEAGKSLPDALIPPIKLSSKQPISRNVIYLTHGILLALAWGFFAPLAVFASILRIFLPKGMWIRIHMYSNYITLILTVMGFLLPIVYFGKPRFSQAHFILGWIVMLTLLLQVMSGIYRPGAEQVDPNLKLDTLLEKTGHMLNRIKLGSVRAIWEMWHKVAGWFLLVAGLLQAHTGFALLTVYGINYSYVWIVWVPMLCMILLYFYRLYKDIGKERKNAGV